MGFCNDIPPSCDTCLEAIYGKCNDVITISLGLSGLTTFFLNLIDKFDIVTQLTVITDANGDFTITQTWTEFFGPIEIEVYADPQRATRVTFTVGGTNFDCVTLEGAGACSNRLDFSEVCNSQYLTVI